MERCCSPRSSRRPGCRPRERCGPFEVVLARRCCYHRGHRRRHRAVLRPIAKVSIALGHLQCPDTILNFCSFSINVDMLLASSTNSTRAFRLNTPSADEFTLQEVNTGEYLPIVTTQPTVAASIMRDSFLVQVTPRGVVCVDLRTGTMVFDWSCREVGDEIVAAAIGDNYIVGAAVGAG